MLSERGRKRLQERFGSWKPISDSVVWLHGASVGEVNSLLPLVPGLRQRFPNEAILLTATSTTGLDRAENEVDYVRLLPFDCRLWLQRALGNTNIRLFVFAETELWPACIQFAVKKAVPSFMVNAVISDFTYRTYAALRFIIKPVLKSLTAVAAADQQSAGRLLELGARPDALLLTGNVKYDRAVQISNEKAVSLKKRYAQDDKPLVVLGSIHPGELAFWQTALLRYQSSCNWIVAPRHLEKLDIFIKSFDMQTVPYQRSTSLESKEVEMRPSTSLVLLDQMGVLESLYSIADLAFIGGSLVSGIGGHNPLEAMAYSVPVAIGQYHENVRPIVEQLREREACYILKDESSVLALIEELLASTTILKRKGESGNAIFLSQQGATERTLAFIGKYCA